MKYRDIIMLGRALGHAVAVRLPDEYPGSPGKLLDAAMAAECDERAANRAAQIAANPIQPIGFSDRWGLTYSLGSWAEARMDGQGKWVLSLRDNCPKDQVLANVEQQYGIKFPDNWEEAFMECGEPRQRMSGTWTDGDTESPVRLLWDMLAELLPDDHYSGRAYSRLVECDSIQ